jgi:transcriptional regulator
MYIPEAFVERDVERARALIASHSFGMLVVPRAAGVPEITHLPFLLDAEPAPYGTLRAHVARANPIAKLLAEDLPVVAVFTGPHAYVSPRWYVAPDTNVPTWNFTAVHAHGVARKIHDHHGVLGAVADLASVHEASAPSPWSAAGADHRHIESRLVAIVAFTIRIERFESKFKLSQNRPREDRLRVIERLRERRGVDDEKMAAMIEANEVELTS